MNTTDFTVRLTPETGRTVAVWNRDDFDGTPSDETVDTSLAANEYARVGLVRVTESTVECDVRGAR